MKKILAILATAFAVGLPAYAADRPNIVNGMPCVPEVCVGEDLNNLGQIKWESMSGEIGYYRNRKIPEGEMIGDPAAIKAITPYWTGGKLDPKAFALIKKIKGFCEPNSQPLEATYRSSKRKITHVYFQLIGLNNGQTQKFVVSSIDTIILNDFDLTMEQREQIKKDVSLKYPGLLDNKSMFNTTPYVEAGAVRNIVISLNAPSFGKYQNRDIFRRFPGCGGDRKIQID